MISDFRAVIGAVVFAVMLFALFPAQAQTSQEIFQQYIVDLQKSPDDNALREKIIKLAQEMKPAPVLSDEAQKHLDRGVAAIEGAKSEEDFKDACAEFAKVLTIAPWFGSGYRPLAIAQDKSDQYDAALKNLEFYLLSQPSSEDTAWAKSLMNKIEYRKEKDAKESSPEAVAERKQSNDTELIKSLDGARYAYQSRGPRTIVDLALDIRGTILIASSCLKYKTPEVIREDPVGVWVETARMRIVGRQANFSQPDGIGATLTISEDGKSITWQGPPGEESRIFYREK